MNTRAIAFVVLAVVADVGAAHAIESPQTPTTLSLQGTIAQYTPATRTLSLSTPRGTIRFCIAPTIRIRQGWRKLDASELEKLAGHRATIRYTQSGDRPLVESVHVFGR